MGYNKSTFYSSVIKMIAVLFCLAYAQGCDDDDDDDTIPSPSPQAQAVIDYLVHEWNMVEEVTKCDSLNVTGFYTDLNLTIGDKRPDTDSLIVLNYDVEHGSPAFPEPSGTISFQRSSNFTADTIEGIRDDGKKIVFKSMKTNIGTSTLLFDLYGTADDDCSASSGRTMVFGGHSVLIKR